jgi:hypothetical protein
MAKRMKPGLLSRDMPRQPVNDDRPFVDDGLWTGITWGAVVSLCLGGIIILIMAAIL